jgi:hypothetical protein
MRPRSVHDVPPGRGYSQLVHILASMGMDPARRDTYGIYDWATSDDMGCVSLDNGRLLVAGPLYDGRGDESTFRLVSDSSTGRLRAICSSTVLLRRPRGGGLRFILLPPGTAQRYGASLGRKLYNSYYYWLRSRARHHVIAGTQDDEPLSSESYDGGCECDAETPRAKSHDGETPSGPGNPRGKPVLGSKAVLGNFWPETGVCRATRTLVPR